MLKLNNLSGGATPEGATGPPSSPGNMYVWGNNDSGQLGLGTTATQNTPIINTSITQPIFKGQVSGASLGAFVSDGLVNLKAAGENTLGQLGDGTTTDKTSFVSTSVSSSLVTFINGGGDFSIYSNGGVGTIDEVDPEINVGLRLAGNTLSDWTQEIDSWAWVQDAENSGSMELTCAPSISHSGRGAVGVFLPSFFGFGSGRPTTRSDHADILQWGPDRQAFMLDIVSGGSGSSFPVIGKSVKVIAVSETTTLALDENGGGYSFSSDNVYGEVGQNADIGASPVYGVFKTDFESGVTDIAGNEFNSFMIKGGAIFASGSYQTGCVGATALTDETNITDPIQLGSATNWAEIQTGENCLIARNSVDELWFIGNNTSSQKGVAPDGITTELTLMDSPNLYSTYLVTLRSVYAVRI